MAAKQTIILFVKKISEGFMKRIYAFLVLLLTSNLFAQSNDLLNSYLAHIAAANLSLKQNNLQEAKIWLLKTPVSFRGWEWDLLNSISDQSIKSFSVDEYDTPTKITYSNDGRIIAIGTTNGNIYLLNASTFEKIYSTHIHQGVIYDIKFSETGEEVYTCSSDTTLVKYNLLQKKVIWSAFTETIGKASIDINYINNAVLFGSFNKKDEKTNGVVSIFDAQKGRKLWSTDYGGEEITSVRFRKDGKYFAFGTTNGQIPIWDFGIKQRVRNFDFSDLFNNSVINDLAFSPNGLMLSVVSSNSFGRIWDLQSGKILRELVGHSQPILSTTFNNDGTKLFTADQTGSIFMWNVSTGQLLNKYFGHKEKITSTDFSPTEDFLISASDDKSVRLWNAKSGSEFTNSSMLSAKNNVFALNKNSTLVVTNGNESSITVWDAKNGSPIKNFSGFTNDLLSADISDDDSLIVGCSSTNSVRIWKTKNGEIFNDYTGISENAISCDFHPAGKMITAASTEGAVYIWDISKNTPIAKLAVSSIPTSVKFSPDGKYLSAGCADGKLFIWSTAKFQKTFEKQAHSKMIYQINFSSDSKKIMTSSDDKTSKIHEAENGKLALELKGHRDKVLCGSFSNDNTRVATGSADNIVKIWDLKNKECVLSLNDFSAPVLHVKFSADNQKLYVTTVGGKIRVYNRTKSLLKF
ncbi:MAG: hypothetical protein CO129_11330 [Ignavibacteriales bacterium CG_4_9_14_3_um_filter_34_10]|nr:MAG: hypothetical protein CO129_11330 [Ignavibacteriales bacterium CG_4_9_14_3_um_filter_34_10]